MKFLEVAEYFQKIEKTTKRLEMFDILSELLSKADKKEIDKLIYFCEERILPPFYGVEIGVAEKMLEKAIARAYGTDIKRVKSIYSKKGDLGLAAEELAKKVTFKLAKPKPLEFLEVYDAMYKVAKTSGSGAVDKKISIISGILARAKPIEARYIARFVIGRLRLGIGDPTIMDALSKIIRGDKSLREKIEHAYNLCSDLGLVAKELVEKGEKALDSFKAKPGNPIRMALAERLPSAEEIIKKLGRCAVESKYDGFRLQCHKTKKGEVFLFSRNLENMTNMFPDIVEAIKKEIKAKEVIFEGEAIAYNEETGELFPFQVTITRKRKYEIEKKKEELPLKLFAFDLLYIDGKDYTGKPYEERRKKLEKIIKKGGRIEPADRIITDDPKEIEKYFDEVVSAGLEGVMAKRLDAPYTAGARNFNWIKLKRSYKGELADTIDVVIVGYFKGRGARAKLGIGAILAAVYDEKEDEFKTIAKIGSGFSEEEWKRLKKDLDEIKTKNKPARVDSLIKPDVWVEPKYVVTVRADEITKSPTHTAGMKDGVGYALRFPRAEGYIRFDKGPEDANTVKEIIEMFKMQKHKKII